MPLFNTGNQAWDQGLNTLGGALFPDPSKVAQSYYYGAEARNAQIGAAQKMDQMAALHRFGMMQGGDVAPPPPTYAPAAGPNMPLVMQDPYAATGGTQPPPTLSATVTQPPAAGPPAAGPPAGPPSLGTTVAGDGGGPTVVGQGPNGGAIVKPTMSPAQAGDQLVTAINAHPTATQGPAPAASPPAPSAPPAPNSTGSDGSVPNNDQSSGALHPGSITPTDGGVKVSGPAGPNGSPARPAVTLAQYVAAAALAGMDASQARAQGSAMLASLYQRGIIDRDTYHQMLGGVGEPSMGVEDVRAATDIKTTGMREAGATTRTGMTVAGENLRQGMVTGETAREYDQGVVQVVNPDDPNGPPLAVKRADLKPGMQEFNQAVATQRGAPTIVQPRTGGPAVNVPAAAAMKPGPDQPAAYDTGVAQTTQQQTGAFGNYIDPKDPTKPAVHVTAAQASANGLVAQPTSTDQWTATMNQAIASETDPAKRQALIERYASVAAIPRATGAEEGFKQSQVDYQTDQRLYPMPQTGMANLGVQNPVAFTPEAQQAIDQRTQALQTQSLYLRNNPSLAHERAVQSLQQDGTLPSAAEINAARVPARAKLTSGGFAGDPRISVYQPPGAKTGADHMMIGLRKPGGQPNQPNQPQQPNQPPVANQPPGPNQPPLSSVVVPTPPPPVVSALPAQAPHTTVRRVGPPAITPPTVLPPIVPQPGVIPGTEARGGPPAAPPAAPTPPAAAPQSRPIAQAPQGVGEGGLVYQGGRAVGVVHGGMVYALPAGGGNG